MEFFVNDMRKIPVVVERRLTELRAMDTESNAALKASAAEEAQLFDDLATLAKTDPDFDEGPITQRFQELLARRHDTLNVLDEQMKKIQKLYDLVDGRITFIDSSTKEIAHLFPQGSVERGNLGRKKKRKKASTDDALTQSTDDLFPDNIVAFDPNEPVYCTCRQISFGNMIACENPDCAIEWFHFPCVGLKEDPGEPWFCSQCKE